MPTITSEELFVLSAAFGDIRKTVAEIRRMAPDEVSALCDYILTMSERGLAAIEAAAQRPTP